MGVVYEAEHRGLGRKVAVKVLRVGTASSDVQAARFQREAELVSRIGHPNIVEVYDFGRTADGSLYFVMELLRGESLRARLRRGVLSDAEIAETFAPLLSAISAAHALGIIHRDTYRKNRICFPASQHSRELRTDGDVSRHPQLTSCFQ